MSETKLMRDDLAEKDVTKDIRESFELLNQKIITTDEYLTKVSDNLKKNIPDSQKLSLRALQDLTKANKDVKDLYEKILRLEEKKLSVGDKAMQQAIKDSRLRVQESKERMQNAREIEAETKAKERAEKFAERERKTLEKNKSSYEQLKRKYSEAANELKELGAKQVLHGRLNAKEAIQYGALTAKVEKYYQGLVKVNESVGQHQIHVGNYAKGFVQLDDKLRLLLADTAAFQNSINTGIAGISNNLEPFITQFKVAIQESGSFKGGLLQLGKSFMSFSVIATAAVTLFTLFGEQLINYVGSLFEADKATKANIKSRKEHNERIKEGIKYVAEESARYYGLITTLKNTNKGSRERAELIQKINDTYGTTLKNISDEKAFQDQLNKSVEDYIKFKEQEFRIKANEDLIAKGLEKQSKLKKQIFESDSRIITLKERAVQLDAITDDFDARHGVGLDDEIEKRDQLKDQLNELNQRLKSYGLNIGDATSKMEKLGFKTGDAVDKTKELEDLSKRIREEQIKRITDETQKFLEEIKLRYDEERNQIIETYAIESQKKQLLKELEATYLFEIDQYYRKLEKDQFDRFLDTQKKQLEAVKQRLEEEEKIREKQQKQLQDNLDEAVQAEADRQKKIELARDTAVIEGRKTQQQATEERINDLENELKKEGENSVRRYEIEKELAQLRKDLNKSVKDQQLQNIKEMIDATKGFADEIIKIEELIAGKQIAAIDREIEARKEAIRQREKDIEKGNILASESLALEREELRKSEMEKAEIEKRMANIKLVTATLELLSKTGSAAASIQEATKALAGIKGLISYDVGTDSVPDIGAGVDGKGGMPALIHKNEMILTAEEKKSAGITSRKQVTDVMKAFNAGKLIDSSGASQTITPMVNFEKYEESFKKVNEYANDLPKIMMNSQMLDQERQMVTMQVVRRNNVSFNRFIKR
ncbi:MAG: hypothetical protein VKN72_11815 [Nostocales cyanobacterium 94392]|nr:hypothetical protein [Nostocales cyanobacterium 94392]